jgi:hypothetical protein
MIRRLSSLKKVLLVSFPLFVLLAVRYSAVISSGDYYCAAENRYALKHELVDRYIANVQSKAVDLIRRDPKLKDECCVLTGRPSWLGPVSIFFGNFLSKRNLYEIRTYGPNPSFKDGWSEKPYYEQHGVIDACGVYMHVERGIDISADEYRSRLREITKYWRSK